MVCALSKGKNYMNSFVGRDTLISHGAFNADNQFTPTSAEISGQLIYAADSSLSVLILFKNQPIESKDLLAYTGRYTVGPKQIIHHIEVCNYPDRQGNDEPRNFKYSDNILSLSARLSDGRLFEAKWARITLCD